MLNKLFLDKLDRSRIVVPYNHKNNGRTLLCRVYFKGSGPPGAVYAGKVELPASLFETPGLNVPVGFSLLNG